MDRSQSAPSLGCVVRDRSEHAVSQEGRGPRLHVLNRVLYTSRKAIEYDCRVLEWIRKRSTAFWAFWGLMLINGPQGLDAWSNLLEKAEVVRRLGLVAMPESPPVDWARVIGFVIFALILLRDRRAFFMGLLARRPLAIVSIPLPTEKATGELAELADPVPVVAQDILDAVDKMKQELHRFIRVEHIEMQPAEIDGPSPYIEFELKVFNGSVFDVFLEPKIGGHVWYGPRHVLLKDTPEPQAGFGVSFAPGQEITQKIRQYLDSAPRDDINTIASGSPPCAFGFDEIRIQFGANNDGQDRRFPLQIPNTRWFHP